MISPIFCSSKDLQNMNVPKIFFAGVTLEKVKSLVMEIRSIPSMFYITDVKA